MENEEPTNIVPEGEEPAEVGAKFHRLQIA